MSKSGWEWTENNFATVAAALRANAKQACEETAYDILEVAQEKAPVDTGALRASIHPVFMDSSGYNPAIMAAKQLGKVKNRPDPLPALGLKPQNDGEVCAAVDVAMPYASFLEFGTFQMAAQPFLIPAFTQCSGVFERYLRQAMVIRTPSAPKKQVSEADQRLAWQAREMAAVRREEREYKAAIVEDMRAKIAPEQFQRQRFNVKNMDVKGRATYQRETFGEMWERLRRDYEGMK